MNLTPWRKKPAEVERSYTGWGGLWNYFQFNGNGYPYGLIQYSAKPEKQEEVGQDFVSLSQQAYASNSVVFACMAVRMLLFAEARFQFRRLSSGRPGQYFGTEALAPLETPAPGQTTGDLLTRAITDVDLAGNFFAYRDGQDILRLRPDWVDVVLGSNEYPNADEVAYAPDAQVVGYQYWPGGKRQQGVEPILYLREEVAHFAPYKDPLARYRGISWLTPVIDELMADKAMTAHRLKFFENGATPNHAVVLNTEDPDRFQKWMDKLKARQDGVQNAYETMYLGAGASVIPLGADMQQLDFKIVQGAGETRIAAAAQIPPVIVGLSEGLAAATYSNYELAVRRAADFTFRPLWRDFCASMSTIIEVPPGSQLWYDDRDIPALRDDVEKAAKVRQMDGQTMRTLVDAGFEADSVQAAVDAGDWNLLVHTGLFSVQLQPPGTVLSTGNQNGNGTQEEAARELAEAILARAQAGDV